MKSKLSLLLIMLLVSIHAFSQAPDWAWAKSAASEYADQATSIATDPSGNVYVVGAFQGDTLTFDSTSVVGNNSCCLKIYIVKFDASGNLLWTTTAEGGTGNQKATAVTTDALGNLYVAGLYGTSSISFGATMLMNAGIADIFFVKYDTDGNLVWAKRAGGNNEDIPTSLTIDAAGNLLMTGNFGSTIIAFGSILLNNTNAYWTDVFLAKYDADGNELWAVNGGGDLYDDAYSVTTDASDNIFVTGAFQSNTITFGATTLIKSYGPLTYDMFIVKYNSNGNVQWAKRGGWTNSDYAYSVAVDISGNILVAGTFRSFITFDLITLTGVTNDDDIFLVKYNNNNGDVIWAKSAGGTYDDGPYTIMPDASGGIYLSGYSEGDSISFDSIKLAGYNTFIVKYDGDGNANWATITAKNGFSYSSIRHCMTADAAGNILLAGSFQGDSIHFGTTTLISSGGNGDVFIAKLGDACLQSTFYADTDSDGFGNINDTIHVCAAPIAYVDNHTDCNDINPNVNPNAIEISGNAIDDDCDGLVDEICSANFYLVADSLIPHHYWALNTTIGIPPLTYSWSWGDGTYDAIAYPNHTYATAGFYTICLSIQDSTGCFDSTCYSYQLQKMSSAEAGNTIITVNVVDSIPSIPTDIQGTNVLQSWSVFPNPASGHSFVNYTLLTRATVSIDLYDVLGNKMQQSANADQEAGEYNSALDARKLANGIYLLQIRAGDQIASQKIVVMN